MCHAACLPTASFPAGAAKDSTPSWQYCTDQPRRPSAYYPSVSHRQQKSRIQVWLYEQVNVRIEGRSHLVFQNCAEAAAWVAAQR